MTSAAHLPHMGYYPPMPVPYPSAPPGHHTGDLLRVLIVEDHQLVSEALARALTGEGEIVVVGLARTVADARERLRLGPVDIVLLDYHLPDGDGLMVARHIIRDHPGTRIIMVSAQEDRDIIKAALEAGCTGFIGKSESFVHLPNAIRSAAQGTTALSPSLVAKLINDPATQAGGGADGLTERELEILRMLANGVDSAAVAESLFMSQHTLRNYLTRINLKLDTHSKLEAVSKALRAGLITLEREDTNSGTSTTRRRRRI